MGIGMKRLVIVFIVNCSNIFSIAISGVSLKAGTKLGQIFSIRGSVVEIHGSGVRRMDRGDRLIVKGRSGEFILTVTETYHSKINCRIVSGKNHIAVGDSVFSVIQAEASESGTLINDPTGDMPLVPAAGQ